MKKAHKNKTDEICFLHWSVWRAKKYSRLYDGEKLYKLTDGSASVEVNGDMTLTSLTLGVELLDGAQVRIGDAYKDGVVNLEDTKSALRFIGTIDKTASVAGIEGASYSVKIKAAEYQRTNNMSRVFLKILFIV